MSMSMKHRHPYIHIIPQPSTMIPFAFDNERGISYRPVKGEHAIWAARVPFLPAMRADDFAGRGNERIGLIMRRQFRFLYDLARAKEYQTTFELRYITTPHPIPGLPNVIDIIFFGKVFSARERGSQELAEPLWRKFVSNFPLEDPFNYPIEPITDPQLFLNVYEPFALHELDERHVVEIRKFEDMPLNGEEQSTRTTRRGDYIAHPYVPSIDFSAMGRFLSTLAVQSQRCFVGVSLRPIRMFPQEIHNVSTMIGVFKQDLADQSANFDEYYRSRAALGAAIYQQLMNEREQLVTVRVYLVGEHEAPLDLVEAFGSEIMGNVGNAYPTQWSLVRPPDLDASTVAFENIRLLEQTHWGHTVTDTPDLRPFQRLRYLATAHEAFGAFRLPIPPESGYMPGILVKTEPFVALADQLEQRQIDRDSSARGYSRTADTVKRVSLGIVYHRGNPTAQEFEIAVRDLTRHALIAGSTGSGKSNTIKHILSQLWSRHRIPFLVLYPIDKPDYRELRGYDALANDLLVFTLGDESTSPFRFNPFEVPDGLLLKTHLSRLMRVFEAAFSLHDPLPMIYREALRKVYREAGWDISRDRGRSDRDYPVIADFYRTIGEVAGSLQYGREIQSNVIQASVIRIGDLLENAGHVLNVRRSISLQQVLSQPTVMELGRVGSPQDTALLMGFLLMRFAAELERSPRPADHPHITVVEEAHRLMAANTKAEGGDSREGAGEDFSNILAEVRGFGEGLMIAEQIPTLLVKGAIGNTYLKVMHWLEDPQSFELFSQIMNLSAAQRDYARTLTPGFAVVRSPYGQPVHIKIPDVTRSDTYSATSAQLINDDHIRAFMEIQRQRLGIADVPAESWSGGVQASGRSAPTRCRFCTGGSCPAKLQTDVVWSQRTKNGKLLAALYKALEDQNWPELITTCTSLLNLTDNTDPATVYCIIGQYWLPKLVERDGSDRSKWARLAIYTRNLRQFAKVHQLSWAVTLPDDWWKSL